MIFRPDSVIIWHMDYTIKKIKAEIIEMVAAAIDRDVDKSKIEITVPPQAALGDLAVPCFYFTKLTRISPNQIAAELKAKIHAHGLIKKVENAGPYLNFYLDGKHLAGRELKEIAKTGGAYGQLKWPKQKIMLEFSQPNTHKEFHIGHLRNAVLGNALVNILRFTGQKVIAANYIGDIGSHVAKCLWAFNKFHQNDVLPENKGRYLGQIYAEASRLVEDNPAYKREADEVLQKLESGNRAYKALWKKTRQWSLDDFNRIYKILGIKFDKFYYESEVEKPGKKIVDELLARGLAEKSEGAVIINLEKYNLKNFLLLKSDGTSLYSTKDLALAQMKFKKYNLDQSLMVVDNRQSFYFQQLFRTLQVMGFDKKLEQIPYEILTLKDGAMASRKGNVVLFEDFYAEIVNRAAEETKKRHADWPENKIRETAEKIALAALKFNMLKIGNNSIIIFNIDEALSFEGYSGPYLQYMVSRINSILKKESAGNLKSINFARLNTSIEKELLLKLAEFPEAVERAASHYEPSEIARYLFDCAKIFSNFYQSEPVLSSEEKTKQARLALISAVRQVLINGLDLLGIETLDQM